MKRLHNQRLQHWVVVDRMEQLRIPTTIISHTSTPLTTRTSCTIIRPFSSAATTKYFPSTASKVMSPKIISSIRFCTATTTSFTQSNDNNNNIQGTIPKGGHGIRIMQYAEIYRKFTLEDVSLYGNLIGDLNPIHHQSSQPFFSSSEITSKDTDAKESSSSSKVIVHGMLISSLFSSIFGTLIPGSMYRSQTLKFHVPVRVDDAVIGRVDVVRLRSVRAGGRGDSSGDDDDDDENGKQGGVLCTCSTKVLKRQTDATVEYVECVTGEATVWLPGIIAA